ncbi:MAG: gamma-glutamylcyclotransferase [Nitrospirales bacterium]|nr:MAG: gamma-glutamylcyclotransferase [Nitrospirales bacterium]
MYYFAYGSNLSIKRLQHRLPSASVVCVARLSEHRLLFHKKSQDGSAKCDAMYTGDADDVVIGVVYEIELLEKPQLDAFEERGYGYEVKMVKVHASQGTQIEAMTYYAIDIDSTLSPYHWYKEHVMRGAREHHFPKVYLQGIERVPSLPDPNHERHAHEMHIYG